MCSAAGVAGELPDAPDGVEAVRRGERLFVLNHTPAAVEVAGVGSLGPWGVSVLDASGGNA